MMNELNVKIFDETSPNRVDDKEIEIFAVISEQELTKNKSQIYFDSSSRNSRRPIV